MLNIYKQQNNNQNGEQPVAMAPTKKVKVDAGRFEDVTGEFTSSQFKRSLWFVTHKVLLYKLFVGLLIVLSIIFWVFSLSRWGDYVVNGIQSDINLHNNLVIFPDYTSIQEHYAPRPIQIAGVSALAGGSKTFDLVAEVSNPNKNFIVHFDYYYNIGNQKTPAQKGFLLAGESHPLVYFGYKEGYPNALNLVMENVVWKRITAHTVANPVAWQADRLNFNVKDFSFTAPQASGGITANVIKFSVTNNSAFGYRDGLFVVGLMQAGGLTAVMPLVIKDFRSLETRSFDLRNFTDNLLITDIQLFPQIDIYKQDVYLAPER